MIVNPEVDREENQHLVDLIVQAQADPDAEYMHPTALQVEEATAEFVALRLNREAIPPGAIEMRAQELHDADDA